MDKKVLLIDGHNFLFKGYYGVPFDAQMSDGTPINGIYGFFALLRKTIEYVKPSHLLIIFDSETGTKQKILINKDYKANRNYDDNIFKQLALIKKCLTIMRIVWKEDFESEADDIIGKYSCSFAKEGWETYIASNDFDFIQLVSQSVYLLRSYHGKIDKYGVCDVCSKFSIYPNQYVDYLSLKGDPSDNIKGIGGIGPKRATYLIQHFGDIEGIYKSFEELDPFYKQRLFEKKEQLIKMREFLRINNEIVTDLIADLFLFDNTIIPDKMGNFLKNNWDDLILDK